MRLVYKYIYKGDKADTERILHYCEVSKNLYNQALYTVKQSLKENKFLFYNDIEKLMKESKNLDGKECGKIKQQENAKKRKEIKNKNQE